MSSKRKQKLRVSLAIFLMLAAAAMIFVLSNLNKNDINYNSAGTNSETAASHRPLPKNNGIKNSQNYNSADRDNEKPCEIEEIDWRPIIEKWKGKEVSKIKTQKKVVALTFDAGGNADDVDKILNTLEKENIKSTVFLTGRFIEKYPDKTKEIVDSGVDLGNHSYSHLHFTLLNLSQEQADQELEKTENLLSKFNVKFKPFFRFPYGERNNEYLKYINDKNYISIRWTVDSLGWKGISGGMTKESVKERIINQIAPGAIVLMHLGSSPDDGTNLDSEALPEIVQELREQGYEFIALTELLSTN